MKEITVNYVYAFIVLFGFVSELYSADAQRQRALVGLAKIVHEATPLRPLLCKKIEKYVGAYHLWTRALSTNARCFAPKLSDQKIAAIEQNGNITVLDAQTGERQYSQHFQNELGVEYAEALSSQHVVLGLKKGEYQGGTLRVLDLSVQGQCSSFDISDRWERFKDPIFLTKGDAPRVAVSGEVRSRPAYECPIYIFTIDLLRRTWGRRERYVRAFPECMTALQGGKIGFAHCHDGDDIFNSVCTLDVVTKKHERIKTPDSTDPSMELVGMIGKNLIMRTKEVHYPSGRRLYKLYRNGKDLGRVFRPKDLLVDIPDGFVTGFDKRLLTRDDDGNVLQELLKDQDIHEVRCDNGLLTVVSSENGITKISAWQLPRLENEAKDDADA